MLPIQKVEPAAPNGSGFAGFMTYHRTHLPRSLILDWDGAGYNFNLEGPNTNRFFEINAARQSEGYLIRTPEIRIDLDSAFDPSLKGLAMGSLVLERGTAYIVGAHLADSFADEALVPLWSSIPQPGGSARVGFQKWGLFVSFEQKELMIWQHSSVLPNN